MFTKSSKVHAPQPRKRFVPPFAFALVALLVMIGWVLSGPGVITPAASEAGATAELMATGSTPDEWDVGQASTSEFMATGSTKDEWDVGQALSGELMATGSTPDEWDVG